MKTLSSLCLAAASLAIGACGANLTCSTTACASNASASYETCVGVTGSVTYKYNGNSCDCSSTNASGCTACVTAVNAYCSGLSAGSDGGASDGSTTTNTDGSTSQCSIVGSFKNTLSNGAIATITTTGTDTAGTFTLVIMTSSTTINIAGNYTESGSQLTMTNTSSTPASVQGCIGEAAVYGLTWSTDCKQVTFAKVSDTCQGRIADANGATLTRQ